LNHGIEDIRVGPVDIDADPADLAPGKAVGQDFPGLSAIGGFVDAASRSAGLEGPGQPVFFIRGGIEDIGVGAVHAEVDDPDMFIDIQHFLPGVASVGRFVNTALLVGGEEVSHDSHVDDIGVFGVDLDPVDMVGVFQPTGNPGFTAVIRPVDSVAGIG